MNPLHLLRMARRARHPAASRRVALVLGVIALCALIAGAEALFGFPKALTPGHGVSRGITN